MRAQCASAGVGPAGQLLVADLAAAADVRLDDLDPLVAERVDAPAAPAAALVAAERVHAHRAVLVADDALGLVAVHAGAAAGAEPGAVHHAAGPHDEPD